MIEIFDQPPEMRWTTMNDEFSVEGKIAGADAWITFFREPFDDEDPIEILRPNGNITQKKPPLE